MREGYKQSNIGIIPSEWDVVKLGEITERITKGTTPTTAGFQYQEAGINFIKVESIASNGSFIPSMFAHIGEDAHIALQRSQLEKNDILFSIAGALGRTAIVTSDILPANTNQALAIIRLQDKDSRQFVYHFLKGEYVTSFINKINVQTAQANLSLGNIQNFYIPMPPQPERDKIAEILSTVDEKIEVINEQIEQTKELKKGLMKRLFTTGICHSQFKDSPLGQIPESWEVAKFKDYTKVNQGLQIAITERSKEKADGSLVYITIQYLNNISDKSNTFYIQAPSKSVICHEDEILMTRTGNTGIVITGVHGVFHNNFFKVDFDRSKFDKTFLFYYLNYQKIQSLIRLYAGATTIPDINHGDFYKIPLIKPSLIEQQHIANILFTTDEKLDVLQEKKTNYQELKKGLMQQLLTGKLRVNHLIEQPELA